MQKVFIAGICAAIFHISTACGIQITSDEIANLWNARGDAKESAGEFIMDGCINKGCSHGTHGDEWGIVAVIANTITENGAYFRPYQLQCANKRRRRRSWTMYYYPSGVSRGAWLCKPGYTGLNCATPQDSVSSCDERSYKRERKPRESKINMIRKSREEMYNYVYLKTSGGDSGQVEGEIIGFNSWGSDPECDVVLGVIQFLDHGVIAAPIQVCCGRDNWKSIDSFVSSVYKVNGSQQILCASGYTANANNSDCVPINPDVCAVQNLTMCPYFDKSAYDSSIHYLEQDGNCTKFFCSEPGKAFPAVGQYTCEDCDTGVKGGANPTNGVCVKCETGQYFDKESNSCKTAKAMTKTDLQYGVGQTKNSRDITKQCWTMVSSEEYKKCIDEAANQN